MKEVEKTTSVNLWQNYNEEYDGTFLPKISDGICGMSCTVNKQSKLIINGNETNPGEFPFRALISILSQNKTLNPLCT